MTTDPQDEIFDIVDENDQIIGQATRHEAHQNPNLIHRVVHVWIINNKNQILIQQRSLTKDKAPGYWDISCGGHIKSGDSPEITVKRELKEELGINVKCMFIKKYVEKFTDQAEMVNLYYAISNGPFKFNEEEITQLKFFSESETQKLINDPHSKFSHFSKQQIPIVFATIKASHNL